MKSLPREEPQLKRNSMSGKPNTVYLNYRSPGDAFTLLKKTQIRGNSQKDRGGGSHATRQKGKVPYGRGEMFGSSTSKTRQSVLGRYTLPLAKGNLHRFKGLLWRGNRPGKEGGQSPSTGRRSKGLRERILARGEERQGATSGKSVH